MTVWRWKPLNLIKRKRMTKHHLDLRPVISKKILYTKSTKKSLTGNGKLKHKRGRVFKSSNYSLSKESWSTAVLPSLLQYEGKWHKRHRTSKNYDIHTKRTIKKVLEKVLLSLKMFSWDQLKKVSLKPPSFHILRSRIQDNNQNLTRKKQVLKENIITNENRFK